MSLDHLPWIAGRLKVRRIGNRRTDGHVLIRTDISPAAEVAVVHGGSTRRCSEAEQLAELLGLSPVMLELLREALGAWAEQFDAMDEADDTDHYVSGADLVEWFADWRLRVRTALTPASACSADIAIVREANHG